MVVRVKPYDFTDLTEELNAQGISAYDVSGRAGSFDSWCDSKGYGQTDPHGKHRGASQIWFAEYQSDPDGYCKEAPRRNLWHWFLNQFENENGDNWVEPKNQDYHDRYIDTVVTQDLIDQTAWVSALLTPFAATRERGLP